ncbi:unnamed protein product [Caretta caretta]
MHRLGLQHPPSRPQWDMWIPVTLLTTSLILTLTRPGTTHSREQTLHPPKPQELIPKKPEVRHLLTSLAPISITYPITSFLEPFSSPIKRNTGSAGLSS